MWFHYQTQDTGTFIFFDIKNI